MNWYVQVQNQNYGPYGDEQMQAFVLEGRVNANSLISHDVNAGFFNAAAFDAFKLWNGEDKIAVGQTQTRAYQPATPQSTPAPQAPLIAPQAVADVGAGVTSENAEPAKVFLVMAEINSEGTMGFLQALQTFGQAERISATVWLLKSQASVEQLRNSLSQTLDHQDRLFLLDSTQNKPAWFNIGADLDHRIRDLWQDDEG